MICICIVYVVYIPFVLYTYMCIFYLDYFLETFCIHLKKRILLFNLILISIGSIVETHLGFDSLTSYHKKSETERRFLTMYLNRVCAKCFLFSGLQQVISRSFFFRRKLFMRSLNSFRSHEIQTSMLHTICAHIFTRMITH